MSLRENPYTYRPKLYLRKEIPEAIVEATALAGAAYNPNVGWTLSASVEINGEHYAVRPYINIGYQWAANAAVLSPLGRELVTQWEMQSAQ